MLRWQNMRGWIGGTFILLVVLAGGYYLYRSGVLASFKNWTQTATLMRASTVRNPMQENGQSQAAELVPGQNLLEGSPLHVAHLWDFNQTSANMLSAMFADIEDLAGTSDGFFVFYRITPVQYTYFVLRSDTVVPADTVPQLDVTARNALSKSSPADIFQTDFVKNLMGQGFVLCGTARYDTTSAVITSDERLLVFKKRMDGQPLLETGRQVLYTELGSTGSEQALAAGFAPFRQGNQKILAMLEWSKFYEVFFVETDRPNRLEFMAEYIELYDKHPERSLSDIQLIIQNHEVKHGWRFVAADRYDGWNDWVTLIFSKPLP